MHALSRNCAVVMVVVVCTCMCSPVWGGQGRREWWCGVECGGPSVTLSGTWSCVLLARHGGGACGAGGVKGAYRTPLHTTTPFSPALPTQDYFIHCYHLLMQYKEMHNTTQEE